MKKIKELLSTHKFIIIVLLIATTVMVVALTVLNRKTEKKVQIPLGSSSEITFSESKEQYHTADDGVAVIVPLSVSEEKEKPTVTPLTVWENDTGGSTNFTMPQQARMDDSSIGILTIPKIALSAKVYESNDQMEDMESGIAHFKHTSAWNGLIGLSAHNINFNGTNGIFLNVYKLKAGDAIEYTTALGERTYVVTETKTINQSDWNDLERSESNIIVLITCISGKPEQRLCVIATGKN